jgi:DNA-binding Lrp family transcriptional regulator
MRDLIYVQQWFKGSMRKGLDYNNNGGSKNRHGTSIKELDAAIIEELLTDAYISSTEISKRHNAPLSTVQRRRRNLENAVLIRRYEIDFQKHGFRIGEITVVPKKGLSQEVADKILSAYSKNISSIFLKIDSSIVLTVSVYFKTTQEIHKIMQGINAISSVVSVSFAETVEIVRQKTKVGITEALIEHSVNRQKSFGGN